MEDKMGKARSPRYPAIGLEEAIQRIEAVYKKDYQNKIPKRVVAEHMGYASLNGKSLGVISAAAKYGLLEGRADEMRVSDEALEMIAHAPGSPERVAAIKAAASKPELFAELDQKFLGGKASDSAIRSYLITQKFLPRAADIILRSYRGTKEVVAAEAAENRELACVEDGLNQGGETDSSGEFGSRGEHLKMEGSCALSSGERV
ncbi:MAG: hypothetical protein V3V17_12705, partial [Alphaproteobacteria bacterium]